MALPQLTDEQRAAALEKAAAARRARAELKDRLKRGGTNLKQVLKDAETRRIYSDVIINAPLASALSTANRTARRLPIPWSANRVGAVVYTTATGSIS